MLSMGIAEAQTVAQVVKGSDYRTMRACQRAMGAGAHQFQRPSKRIVAGTRSMRTMVASTTTAIPMPIPMALITTRSAIAKPKKTAASLEPHGDGQRVVASLLVLLTDAREEQHAVVHRETERHAEHDQRGAALDRAGREVEPTGQVP